MLPPPVNKSTVRRRKRETKLHVMVSSRVSQLTVSTGEMYGHGSTNVDRISKSSNDFKACYIHYNKINEAKLTKPCSIMLKLGYGLSPVEEN